MARKKTIDTETQDAAIQELAEAQQQTFPTLEDARLMFSERPSLDAVYTEHGLLYRDGRIDATSR